MPIKFGIYDFFAYTIPGGVYLVAAIYSLNSLQIVTINLDTVSFALAQVFLFAIASYVVGLLFNPLADKLWYRFFRDLNVPESAFEEFKRKNPHLEIKFKAQEWPVLLAYVRHESMELAADIEKHNVTKIMLRNTSFAFVLICLIQSAEFFIQNFSFVHMALAFVCLLLAVIGAKEASKFDRWFYLIIYETATARTQSFSDFLNLTR